MADDVETVWMVEYSTLPGTEHEPPILLRLDGSDGAVLIAATGEWQASERPSRVFYLGDNDAEIVDFDEACRVARELGWSIGEVEGADRVILARPRALTDEAIDEFADEVVRGLGFDADDDA